MTARHPYRIGAARFVMAASALGVVVGCSPSGERRATGEVGANGAPSTREYVPLVLSSPPLPVVLTPDSNGVVRGLVAGDTTVRLLLRPNSRDDATSRLCGAITTGSTSLTALAFAWPVDSAAPRLAQRTLLQGDVHGVRFVVPGEQARYVFEGLTRDGAQVVSLQWPVRADPARPIPVGAPDSVVEASLQPSVFALDSLVHALRFAEPPDTAWPAVPIERALADARAVTDVRLFPVHPARLSIACPEVTLALPMLARADHTVKIPVNAGDVITANAGATTGAVRIGFDESPPAPEPPAREPVTRANIEATATGQVTLRVRLSVLPKYQLARQTVLVRVQRTHPRP